jgi:uncharacterized protein YndB with AHSA1/START domain
MKWLLMVLAAAVGLILAAYLIGMTRPESHTARTEARFSHSPEEVWALVSDYERWPQWNPDVERVDVLEANGGHPVLEVVGSWGGARTEITVWDPPRRMVTDMDAGDFGGRWTYELAPTADGGTVLTLTETGSVGSPFLRAMMIFHDNYATMMSYHAALAGTLAEAVAIVELAKQHKVPFFSSSSSRFADDLRALLANPDAGDILGAATWGPCSYQEGTPDMFFYGIHGIEALFTVMGTGCETVARVKGANHDIVTGTWKGGRIGAYRGIVKGKAEYGVVAYGSKAVIQSGRTGGYEPLCREIARFFRTGVPPVSAEETLEIFAFMEAADESLRQGGKPVALAEVLAKAKAEAANLIK